MPLNTIIKKYGKTKLHFSNYDKFIFYFEGKTADGVIRVSFGGEPSDIYRFSFDNSEDLLLEEIVSKNYVDNIIGINPYSITLNNEDIL